MSGCGMGVAGGLGLRRSEGIAQTEKNGRRAVSKRCENVTLEWVAGRGRGLGCVRVSEGRWRSGHEV